MKMRKKNTKAPSSRLNPQTKIGSVPKASQRSLLASNARKPRILWVNAYCLLDTSSGASISVRQMLHQLQSNGYDVNILGATNFDSLHGAAAIKDHLSSSTVSHGELLKIKDGALTHHLVKTRSIIRDQMTTDEVTALYSAYVAILHAAKPDLVFFYGGQITDFLIPHEARVRGIPSAAYLVNANYRNSRWCRDVDLIITDTHATAKFYAENEGFEPVPVGKFIDLGKVIAKEHERKHATLINPSWSKGAGIVAMLAVLLEERRPDIKFEVVESRGSWEEVVRSVTREVWGSERTELKNVVVTPNTDDISEVYKRSRIVLGLSQWWESGSRVLAEAMLNGIPAMVSNHGGSPEMVGDGGIIVNLPPDCHQKPFTSMPRPENLDELVQFLERVWDDEPFYLNLMVRALQQGNKLHRMEVSTRRLLEAFKPLVEKRAGDGDFSSELKKVHKLGLEERGASSLVKANNAVKRSKNDYPASFGEQSQPVENIAFFWRGADLTLPMQFCEGIRLTQPKGVKIIQLSDFGTPQCALADEFFEWDLPDEIMLARTIAYKQLPETNALTAFYDTDVLFLGELRVPKKLSDKHLIVPRDDDFIMNANWPEHYPEFEGVRAKEIMPYIGGCFMSARSRELFQMVLNKYQKLPARFHRWYGDQIALAQSVSTRPELFGLIPEAVFLKTTEALHSKSALQSLKAQGCQALHFKGVAAKELLPRTLRTLTHEENLPLEVSHKKTPVSLRAGDTCRGIASSELCRLAEAYGSDKGPKKHDYTKIYHTMFKSIRNLELNILEMGLQIGGPEHGRSSTRETTDLPSVKMWLDYFPNSKMVGLDVSDFSWYTNDRFEFLQCDMESLDELIAASGALPKFDIIIDDASHASHHQQNALACFLPKVKPGGFYIIEDLQWQPEVYEKVKFPKTKDLLSDFLRDGYFSHCEKKLEERLNSLRPIIGGCFIFQERFVKGGRDKIAFISRSESEWVEDDL